MEDLDVEDGAEVTHGKAPAPDNGRPPSDKVRGKAATSVPPKATDQPLKA